MCSKNRVGVKYRGGNKKDNDRVLELSSHGHQEAENTATETFLLHQGKLVELSMKCYP